MKQIATWSRICEDRQLRTISAQGAAWLDCAKEVKQVEREKPGQSWIENEEEQVSQAIEQGFYIPTALFYAALSRCIRQRDLNSGKRVHALTVKSGYESNTFLANHVIRMYASQRRLHEAMQVFTRLATPDSFMWVSIILAHAELGQPAQAVTLYRSMRQSGAKADNHVFVAVLKACAAAADLAAGQEVHADVVCSGLEPSVFVGNCLVDMYSKCSSLEDARRVFDQMPTKDVVSWTAMIGGYSQHGRGQESLSLYASMQQEGVTVADHVTLGCLVKACSSIGALQDGRELHALIQDRGLEADVVIGSCLVDMYAKCGTLEDARRVFDKLPEKDVVAWTAMIAGYAQHGLGQESLNLYASMLQEGISLADHVAFACLLKACASMGALHQGRQLHSQIQARGLDAALLVGNSLVDMYAKCGSLEDASRVFQGLQRKDVVTWSAMISAYAQHGYGEEAMQCFQQLQMAGTRPDEVTFLSLLSACSHAGLVEQGEKYLESMSRDHNITPNTEHYGTMIDLLGRAGRFSRLQELMSSMPMQPDLSTWLCVMGACRKHGNIALGEEAFKQAVQLQSKHPLSYVLMSHIYADAGMLDRVAEVHSLRQAQGAWKKPGESWIELEQEVHTFVVGDRRHPEHQQLHALVGMLSSKLESGAGR